MLRCHRLARFVGGQRPAELGHGHVHRLLIRGLTVGVLIDLRELVRRGEERLWALLEVLHRLVGLVLPLVGGCQADLGRGVAWASLFLPVGAPLRRWLDEGFDVLVVLRQFRSWRVLPLGIQLAHDALVHVGVSLLALRGLIDVEPEVGSLRRQLLDELLLRLACRSMDGRWPILDGRL